jgi:hypothetical protein
MKQTKGAGSGLRFSILQQPISRHPDGKITVFAPTPASVGGEDCPPA